MASEENKRMTLRLGRMSLRAPELIGLLAALLVVIGSIGPWVRTVGEFFVGDEIEVTYAYGIKDDNGQVALVLGILVGVIVLWRLLSRRSTTASTIGLAVAIVLLVVAGLVGVFNWSEARYVTGVYQGAKYFTYEYHAAWGLIILTFAGFTGAGALAYRMWNDHFR
jgi:hypothetical protein